MNKEDYYNRYLKAIRIVNIIGWANFLIGGLGLAISVLNIKENWFYTIVLLLLTLIGIKSLVSAGYKIEIEKRKMIGGIKNESNKGI